MIRVVLFMLICCSSYLQSLHFVFVPDYEPRVETFFSKDEILNYDKASLWNKIKYLLNREGHSVSTSLLKNLPIKKGGNDVRYVIFNTPPHLSKLSEINYRLLNLIVFEPPSVLPKLHTNEYYSQFSKVLTWEDDRVDGKKFLKYYHPVCYPMISEIVPFVERKLCTIMAANKRSKFIGEIYSERRLAIAYFDRFPDQFDLYGPGWEKRNYQTYKGQVESKIDALKNYKFSICYENTQGMNGYITEKIFDCMYAGVVPVYLGAPNIAEDIPSNCFIDKRNFSTYEELHKHLINISEAEFNCYLDNMRAFLISKEAKKYTLDGFALSIVNGLTGLKLTFDDLP